MRIDPGATLLCHQLMRQSSWFGQERAVAATGKGDLNRGVDADLVARRNEERLVPGTGPHSRADDLVAIDERRVGAEGALRFFVLADEAAFGATDCWPVQDDPEVGGKAEATWVGVALTVAEDDVRFRGEIGQRVEDRRRLAE